jgi:hypothetical protein
MRSLLSDLFDGGAVRCIITCPTREGSSDIFEAVIVEATCALKTGRRLSHRPVARAVPVEALALPERTLSQFSPFQLFRAFFLRVAELFIL